MLMTITVLIMTLEEIDQEDRLKNVLLVTGPIGSGKSAATYACAQEQGFEVLETLDCDFFQWADKEMCVHGKRVLQRLKDKKERSWAEVARVEEIMNAELTNMQGLYVFAYCILFSLLQQF